MISIDEASLFTAEGVEARYVDAMRGDLQAIDTLVDWALLILCEKFNASATDKTATRNHKSYSEIAYMIDAAVAAIAKDNEGYIRTYLQSFVTTVEHDVLRVHHATLGEFVVEGQRLTSKLYLDLYQRLKMISRL